MDNTMVPPGTVLDELEDQIASEISSTELLRNMATIAQRERLSGSPEEWEAAEYIRQTLASYGASTTVHMAEILVSLPKKAILTITSPESMSCEAYTHSFSPSTPDNGLERELVYVGPGLREADYSGKDVRDRIALIDGLATPPVAWMAEQQGTAGQIYISGENLHFMIVSTIWGAPTPETASRLPKTPSLSIRRRDGDRLKMMLEHGPVRVQLTTETWTGWRTAHMVEGRLQGQIEPDRFVLFSGHLDSWGVGAMDNAAGNATTLEVARVLALHREELRRSVRFLFWSGHSHGRYAGSAWYADHFWQDLWDHCVAHVNVDSTGARGATSYATVKAMAEVGALAASTVERLTGQRPQYRRVGRNSDQSFWGLGLPALYGSLSRVPQDQAKQDAGLAALGLGGMPWWWHTVDDTPDKIDPHVLTLDTRVFAVTTLRLCNTPTLPFDYVDAANELWNVLDQIQQKAGNHFDLQPLLAQVEQLRGSAQFLDEITSGLEEPKKIDEVNNSLVQLARLLIPLSYTQASSFDQDPALDIPPLPGLQPAVRLSTMNPNSDVYRYLLTRLTRERNRAFFILRKANAVISECLALVGKKDPSTS